MRNNDKTKARAEEREKNIEWIKRLFTAWRVSHAERKEAGEDDPEEDETPVEIPPSAVTIYPKGTPVPTPTVEVQVLETRVDLSNDTKPASKISLMYFLCFSCMTGSQGGGQMRLKLRRSHVVNLGRRGGQ